MERDDSRLIAMICDNCYSWIKL